jgi:hypothetical protein
MCGYTVLDESPPAVKAICIVQESTHMASTQLFKIFFGSRSYGFQAVVYR